MVEPRDGDHPSVGIAVRFLRETQDHAPFAADADPRQPLLKLPRAGDRVGGTDPHKRFVFWNQAIPFIGRQDDIADVETFLAPHESPFRWMLLAGSGGMGKSRLALEICQTAAAHWWNAGFADPSREGIDWRTWQPRLPTLIVVDYAGRLAEAVGVMLSGLSDRTSRHRLRHPVRVLVIERDEKGPWLDTILRSSRLVDDSLTRHPTRTLAQLGDIWPLFQAIDGADRLGRAATIDALSRIDAQQRPLFAFLMADAIARGDDVRAWDRTALLKTVIERDAAAYWHAPSTDSRGGQTRPAAAC